MDFRPFSLVISVKWQVMIMAHMNDLKELMIPNSLYVSVRKVTQGMWKELRCQQNVPVSVAA
jgi:hypothetical protein